MVASYCPQRGDLIWIDFDPQSGKEIMKRRPALVVSPKDFNRQGGVCLVCPVTSKSKGRPLEVRLTSLDTPSVVLSGNIHTFDWRSRRAKFIKKAPADALYEVVENIAALIGVEEG